MRRPLLLLLLLLAAGAVPAAATQLQQPAARAGKPAGAASTPSRGLDNETLNGAVAGVLVAALTEQFGGRAVSIMLDSVDVQASSIRDRLVSGTGRARIEGDEDWLGFRFSTLYDTTFNSAAYPDISLGGVASGERDVPNDTALVRELDDNVVARLGKEFANQQVRLQLDRITTVEAGKRYLRINASGIADFGPEGTSPARIEALYDRRGNAWLRVSYELGPGAEADASVADVGRLAGG
jgi:hypothetical protein